MKMPRYELIETIKKLRIRVAELEKAEASLYTSHRALQGKYQTLRDYLSDIENCLDDASNTASLASRL